MAISVNMLRLRAHERGPAAHEERPARPQHHRRRQRELHPVRRLPRRCSACRSIRWPPISSTTTGKASSSPIQNRRVMSTSSGFGPRLGARLRRLERHAADRAGAGPDLPDLGMHRTGVDRALRYRLRAHLLRGRDTARVGDELGAAAGRAEVIGAARVAGSVLGRVRIDIHPAHRVLCGSRNRLPVSVRVPVVMAVRSRRRAVASIHDRLRAPWGLLLSLDAYTP